VEDIKNIDICVVTYNRLEYLKLCIWSILASTKINYRLFVLSDCSTDGTNEWLLDMKKNGKIDEVIINDENIGTANSFNKVIRSTDSEWFVMSCDDMYFHRGWDDAAINLIKRFDDCGISSFWNYPYNIKPHSLNCKIIGDDVYYVKTTGLAGSIINRELFDIVGGFFTPPGIKMGYIANPFCKKSLLSNLKRNKQYGTIPFYSEQMDRNNPGYDAPKLPPPKLSQEYLYTNYNKRRNDNKIKFKNLKK